MTKSPIPKALREQVWIRTAGKQYEIECPIRWCKNRINAFDFHVGHNTPESAGGSLAIENLVAICARCNLSMGSTFTIDQWQLLVHTSAKSDFSNDGWSCIWPWRKAKIHPKF